MCGIAGAIGAARPDRDRIERTLRLMSRRGPDGSRFHQERVGGQNVTLLFARLAIVDLDDRSMQPFIQDDIVLVTNGELYNYVELKSELEAKGQVFRTTSDTEVLLQAWRHWGEAAFDRMEGMWAFALIDRKRAKVVLSRDRFGEKPLYVWQQGDTLYFGSEIKFLAELSGRKPDVDAAQVKRYLVNGYKSLYKRPHTYYREVAELPAASYAIVDGSKPITPQPYWQLAYRPRAMSMTEAIEGTRAALDEAVRIRLRADVPIAFCLSGGIDSTMLVGIAAKRYGQKLHTFSIIDSDERYHELDNIDATVEFLDCESFRVHTSTEGFFERLRALVGYHDAPVATITYYLHAFLSEAIHARGYRVAVSGTAADELFTGYYDHYSMWLAEMSGRSDFSRLVEDWKGSYGAYVQNPVLKDPLAFVRNPAERGHIYLNADLFQQWLVHPFEEKFEETHFTDNLLRNRMLNELFHEATPVILKEDDLNSMYYSVENRSPYLDRRLAEFLYTVPAEHLIRDGYAKWLLRAAGEGIVVDRVRLDKRKRGFNASIDSLVDRTNNATRQRLLSDGPIFDIVRRDAIEAFLDGSMNDNSFSKFLFSFISAQQFLEHHRDWRV
ncbi:MAG: asparagine synthase (glutamine-hydrolyzing) [Alphaproteobacteria bacterium]|nr:asparagine synthase (glutamine-hydrolyzing) [Alphaproteobacteria bacterium]